MINYVQLYSIINQNCFSFGTFWSSLCALSFESQPRSGCLGGERFCFFLYPYIIISCRTAWNCVSNKQGSHCLDYHRLLYIHYIHMTINLLLFRFEAPRLWDRGKYVANIVHSSCRKPLESLFLLYRSKAAPKTGQQLSMYHRKQFISILDCMPWSPHATTCYSAKHIMHIIHRYTTKWYR